MDVQEKNKTDQPHQLPEGWSRGKIKDLVRIRNGYAFNSQDFKDFEGIPVIRQTNLRAKYVSFEKLKFLPFHFIEKYKGYIVKKGDVLIGLSGSVGNLSIYGFSEYALQNQRTGLLVSVKKGYKKYIEYYLALIKNELLKEAKGVAVQNISSKTIENWFVPIPPPEQQKQIVTKIEVLFSHIDAGIENLKIAKDRLKQYRQSVLKAAVTGELTKDWREANKDQIEPADQLLQRILKERRQRWEEQQLAQFKAKGKPPKNDKWKEKYKEPDLKKAGDSINEGWIAVELELLAEVKTGATPRRGNPSYYENGTIPWVTSGALNDLFITKAHEFITEKAVQETNVSIFPKHTLLIAMYGEGKTRGKVSELLVEAGTNQACAGVIFKDIATECRPYLKLFFLKNYDDIRRLSSGGVQPNLNLSIIKSTEIPLPPLEEQKEIVRIVEEKLTAADRLINEIDTKLTQAQQQKQTILASAFKGKLAKGAVV